jgi:acyl carrier protein
MANTETKSAEDIIVASIEELIKRRGGETVEVKSGSNLLADLGMDSLEMAELSVMLADEIGKEPFSEGIFPETVAELVTFCSS